MNKFNLCITVGLFIVSIYASFLTGYVYRGSELSGRMAEMVEGK